GIILFVLNVPVLIIGWFKIGRGFTIYSILSVIFATFFLEILPIITVSEDIILNEVVGGVISGVAVGVSLKYGASTVGMDIVAIILSRLHDRPIGIYFLTMIAVIIFASGYLYETVKTMYSLIVLYNTNLVIDS